MLDLQRLRVFRAVVASGSVQAAADHLGYTPSAVSQQLAALQRETGLVLFEKAGRGIAPTPVGKVLATESDDVMGSLARLNGLVGELREGGTGTLSIGSFASAAQSWLPRVAKGLRRELPDLMLELSLEEVGAGSALPGDRDIDIATERTAEPGRERPGYTRHVLVEEGYYVVAPRGHALLEEYAGPVPLSALAGLPMVDNDLQDSTCSLITADAYRAAGFAPRIVARSDDHHTALAFVAAGVGVTVLPALASPEAMPGVEDRPLVNPAPRRRIVAHVRNGVVTSPPVVRALALLREAVDATVTRREAS